MADIPHRVRKPLSRIIDSLSRVSCSEERRKYCSVPVFSCLQVHSLIPYFVMLAAKGLPTLYLELEIGQ